ncbi:MAG: hypothetical protein M0P69_18620 [Bacteroidales bacterium]|nr:hypothetical protein [Bacteroidales bacterium]
MKCYACDSPGKLRDIGGTTYHLCDSCYSIHIIGSKLALALLQGQLILKRRTI